MPWNITITGTPEEIVKAFDAEYNRLAHTDATVDERLHMLDASDFVRDASRRAADNNAPRVTVNAHGHYVDGTFTRLSVTLERAPVFNETPPPD